MSGLDVCRAIRSEFDLPIIVLTALSTEQDKLDGLDLGADDYITKPFSPRELAARVRAVLRRTSDEDDFSGSQVFSQELRFEDLNLNSWRAMW